MTENIAIAITTIVIFGGIFGLAALRIWTDYKLELARLENEE